MFSYKKNLVIYCIFWLFFLLSVNVFGASKEDFPEKERHFRPRLSSEDMGLSSSDEDFDPNHRLTVPSSLMEALRFKVSLQKDPSPLVSEKRLIKFSADHAAELVLLDFLSTNFSKFPQVKISLELKDIPHIKKFRELLLQDAGRFRFVRFLNIIGIPPHIIKPLTEAIFDQESALPRLLVKMDFNEQKMNKNRLSLYLNSILQEIFIRALHLKTTSLGDESLPSLMESLSVRNTITVLNLENNSIGDGGAFLIAKALEKGLPLRKLNLARNNIQPKGVGYLAEALSSNSSLKTLILDENKVSLTYALMLLASINEEDPPKDGAEALGEALEINTHLNALYLRGCGIDHSGKSFLKESLRKNPHTALKILTFKEPKWRHVIVPDEK